MAKAPRATAIVRRDESFTVIQLKVLVYVIKTLPRMTLFVLCLTNATFKQYKN